MSDVTTTQLQEAEESLTEAYMRKKDALDEMIIYLASTPELANNGGGDWLIANEDIEIIEKNIETLSTEWGKQNGLIRPDNYLDVGLDPDKATPQDYHDRIAELTAEANAEEEDRVNQLRQQAIERGDIQYGHDNRPADINGDDNGASADDSDASLELAATNTLFTMKEDFTQLIKVKNDTVVTESGLEFGKKGYATLNDTIDITDRNVVISFDVSQSYDNRNGYILGDATKGVEGKCLAIGWKSALVFEVTAHGKNYTAEFPAPRGDCTVQIGILEKGTVITASFTPLGVGDNPQTTAYQSGFKQPAELMEINRIGVAAGKKCGDSVYELLIQELEEINS